MKSVLVFLVGLIVFCVLIIGLFCSIFSIWFLYKWIKTGGKLSKNEKSLLWVHPIITIACIAIAHGATKLFSLLGYEDDASFIEWIKVAIAAVLALALLYVGILGSCAFGGSIFEAIDQKSPKIFVLGVLIALLCIALLYLINWVLLELGFNIFTMFADY